MFYDPTPLLSSKEKKYVCTHIHEGVWRVGKLPYPEEILGYDENQRVAKLVEIAGRWNYYTDRKRNRRGGGKMEGFLSPSTFAHIHTYFKRSATPTHSNPSSPCHTHPPHFTPTSAET
jgi:hypothetical protein